jgi:hypothetical protein
MSRVDPGAAVDQGQAADSAGYKLLRTAVGVTGLALPLALLIGNKLFFSGPAQGSISYYYYTGMRNLLVGGLCAIGLFLLGYAGYDGYDKWFTNIAGILAICVAFCPTHENNTAYTFVNHLHPIFATGLFIMLGLIALYLFTRRKTDPKPTSLFRTPSAGMHGVLGLPRPSAKSKDPSKRKRNACYVSCGIIIFLCIIAAGITSFLNVGSGTVLLYILETIAVMAFGVAWLVKGLFSG